MFSSRENLEALAGREGVVEAGTPMPAVDGARLLSTREPYLLSLFGVDGEPTGVKPGVITRGRWPAGGSDEAVLDAGVARDAGRGPAGARRPRRRRRHAGGGAAHPAAGRSPSAPGG
ncbi:MAG: hypothetical protein ACE5EF_06445, partial [Dehalococcoidia bacterium]